MGAIISSNNTEIVEYADEESSPIGEIDVSRGLIPALQDVQEIHGYLPQEALEKISAVGQIPLSQVYGVVTFYSQFSLKPRGKHTIKICKGTACHVKGAEEMIQTLKKHLNVEVGDTTEDRLFTLEEVACLGTCFLAPVMMVDDSYYGELNADKVKEVLNDYADLAEKAAG